MPSVSVRKADEFSRRAGDESESGIHPNGNICVAQLVSGIVEKLRNPLHDFAVGRSRCSARVVR